MLTKGQCIYTSLMDCVTRDFVRQIIIDTRRDGTNRIIVSTRGSAALSLISRLKKRNGHADEA